jgi:hypothetical protein
MYRFLIAFVFLGLFAGCGRQPVQPSISPETWASPNLLVNRARLDEIKKAVAQHHPLLTSAYEDLLKTADGLLTETPIPIEGILKIPAFYTSERETQQRLTRQIRKDARIAHALALAGALSGDKRYTTKARDFVYAWVRALKRPVNGGHWWQVFWLEHRGDTPLVITYSFPAFIYAFDLLKGENALGTDEIGEFRQWLQPFVAYCRNEVFYKNNHHNWQVVFLMCAAHALEDETLFQQATAYYRNGLAGQIRSDGALPRELWRKEKCGTYTLMALEGMVQAVHLAEAHGITDLRNLASKKGGTLEGALDFYTEYLRDPGTWKRHTNAKQLNTPENLSDWGYVFEIPYRWWQKGAYQPYMQKRPYGYCVERCYTLDFATLLFAQ